MSDPLNISSLFEEASKEVDRLLPLPGHDHFGDMRAVMQSFLEEAKEGGHIASFTHRAMGVALPTRNREKFWIVGPQFEARYSGRKKPPSADFSIEIVNNDKGQMWLKLNNIGSESVHALRQYSKKKGWQNVLKNPAAFENFHDEPVQAFVRQMAEQIVFSGRFFDQRGQKKVEDAPSYFAPTRNGP